MTQRGSLDTNLPDASKAEVIEKLATMSASGATVERIASGGHASPPGFWYDQDWDEWVLVVRGTAELEFENPPGEEKLGRGDWILIPAHRRHRVRATETDTLWLAVHGKA